MRRPLHYLIYRVSLMLINLIFLSVYTSIAQAQKSSELSIDKIMDGQDFTGYWPENFFWSEDSKTIFFEWNKEGNAYSSWYKANISSGEVTKASKTDLETQDMDRAEYNQDKTLKAFAKGGDIYFSDLTKKTLIQITQTIDYETNPSFSSDNQYIIYQSGGNIYTWGIKTGITKQWSDFKNGKEPKDERKGSEQDEWLKQDQLQLFEVVRDREENSTARDEYRKSFQPERPKTIYNDGNSFRNISMSPDMAYITYSISERKGNAQNTEAMEFVNESGYSKSLRAREKVGGEESSETFYVYHLKKDTVFTIDTKEIDGIFDKPGFLKDYAKEGEEYKETYDAPRKVSFHGPVFSADGKAIVVVRAADNKDRWIMLLDAETGKLKLLDRQRDEAWIGGPGISGWNYSTGNMGWFPDNKTVWYQSEKTGYSHLYTVNTATGDKKQLTNGKYEVLDSELSADGKEFYLTTNEVHPGENHFYKMSANGKKTEKITDIPGSHQVKISPDGKQLAVKFSSSNKPWEMYYMPFEKGAQMKQLTNSTSEAFNAYSWRVPEIVTFKADDGAEVYARLYKPKNANSDQKAIIFVHGAGYLQNVHKWWSSYFREYMFHNFLVDNGYVVLDIDYRGSAGYGRDWRTGIYRHMGGKDLSDQVDGAKFLVEQHGVDKDKIGIYGGSYGGFITLMALFKNPGVFKAGAALRSVTDWAHYNHPYTANILNTPVQDSIAYKQSSPIYFAENLKDNLLMLHGMIDLNVHFQDIVRLSQRLIELEKENWELAVFPMEGHGFREASSWKDEYKRIFKLFEETLQ
ncbi:prolyl oligopeptidase family serine peptidase [Chondrinema litorale]|uniref:prolyl oligopeptidase family serine peptidase n=1 Tax=Chondrinema litorale TaxID=2994555 RepID=UPI002543916E|nr:prolyl oligopeptidase family serine peptidase [Chondrinema litorale]UZR93965.1 prolyl oligopeptidase family serine peptidase [Chondrinema litorale]